MYTALLLSETCLWIWLLSYYDAAVDYLATVRVLPRLVEVAKGSTKEKVIQSLKAQAWSDEITLVIPLIPVVIQEVLVGHPYWYPVHKDPGFWQENITNFEENDFQNVTPEHFVQVLRVLVTILDTCTDVPVLAVACYDLSQFIQYYPAGRIIVSNLKAKDRMMKL
ncbi:hypothetical protein ZIOFF_047025 [Zingiber officinale]|uniref:ATPase V1 complex subunit H C-terminal domain-containing protein n=1 Tax=Zingiber officinale TaxID=94328 RepID=A0A8J5FSD6_ZINOF|nr:hypothetical protein ZIOFF_047025 [Zingiber officinale]